MRTSTRALLCLFFASFSPLYAQQPDAKDDTSAGHRELESQIVALEHKYWEAWRNKDAKTLEQLRTENFREVDQDGMWDKKQAEQGEPDMEITDFTLKNEKVSLLQHGVALLTYSVLQPEASQ